MLAMVEAIGQQVFSLKERLTPYLFASYLLHMNDRSTSLALLRVLSMYLSLEITTGLQCF